jgi:DUF2075 family protein
MIVYTSTKSEFAQDVLDNAIADRILEAMKHSLGHGVAASEVQSWQNSMNYMDRVLADPRIPDDAGVSIEYRIPLTSKRVDMLVTGRDREGADTAVIVELKQWQHALITGKDGIVSTFLGGTERQVNHPSYQAWSYAALLQGFNQAVYEGDIRLHPCAYLHNCDSADVLRDPSFAPYLARAPVFLKSDAAVLRDFIHARIQTGDGGEIVQRIEASPTRPSKALADCLAALLKGNPQFVLIDDQKLIFETARALAKDAHAKAERHVMIVSGGPGTGKSVVAVNLLVALSGEGLTTQYVTKNAAPRAVYQAKLAGTKRKAEIDNLFVGSGRFTESAAGAFDALVVDEAHRLNEKSGLYQNLGDNQIKEIIHASRFSVFFVDEDQKVTFDDIGDADAIRRWATALGAQVHEAELASQFRCNGSDGYLAWLDQVLQVRETAHDTLDRGAYDFQVLDSPRELHERIRERNRAANKARLVAGYCWDWKSKNNPQAYDIALPEYGYRARWNLTTDGSQWIIKPDSVHEVGCIHTCQGLELDYIGVLIGPDLVVRDGTVVTDGSRRAAGDRSIRGFKKRFREDPVQTQSRVDAIIKNTYRTLMTRGQRGCYVFSEDAETRAHFRQRLRG